MIQQIPPGTTLSTSRTALKADSDRKPKLNKEINVSLLVLNTIRMDILSPPQVFKTIQQDFE